MDAGKSMCTLIAALGSNNQQLAVLTLGSPQARTPPLSQTCRPQGETQYLLRTVELGEVMDIYNIADEGCHKQGGLLLRGILLIATSQA